MRRAVCWSSGATTEEWPSGSNRECREHGIEPPVYDFGMATNPEVSQQDLAVPAPGLE
jgi:hypothetical protein